MNTTTRMFLIICIVLCIFSVKNLITSPNRSDNKPLKESAVECKLQKPEPKDDGKLDICANGIGKYYECSARCKEMKIHKDKCTYICGGDNIKKEYR